MAEWQKHIALEHRKRFNLCLKDLLQVSGTLSDFEKQIYSDINKSFIGNEVFHQINQVIQPLSISPKYTKSLTMM